ncbi:hypothetical protein ACFU9X_40460 [Streptomyces atratus]|uniref:hypothetical protein n=1 Tax=Streptomyces atratus TaxID=1893 RepID=UPI003685FA62
MKSKIIRRIAAGVIFLQIAYVVLAKIVIAIMLEDTSAIDHTEPPTGESEFYRLVAWAVLIVLLAGALLLALPRKWERAPRWGKFSLLGTVALIECSVIVGALLNMSTQSFGPDVVLNIGMVALSGVVAFASASELFQERAGAARSSVLPAPTPPHDRS